MATSDAMNFDALDQLLLEADALDRHMQSAYPELYQSAMQAQSFLEDDSFSFPDEDDAPPKQARTEFIPEPQEEILPEIDEDSLQAYFLRRKFEQLPSDYRFERAPAGEVVSRIGDSPAQLPDEELFLYALTKLHAGVSDEALSTIALMERRPGMNPLLAFLPTYTALGNGASRGRIEGLASKRISGGSGEAPEKEMVLLSQQMLAETLAVVMEAEALQEAGYRNRQEALTKAAQNVRQRLSRLNY